ncbi:MAG TPA: hypothetical protein VFM18_11870 [Methanosarcina sp.]|nr:hypothetical protein [Methanosarcina sp.]
MSKSTNQYHKENVNVPQGPRTGNSSAHDGKRGDFKAEKASRAPLAKVIQDAYAARQSEYEDYDIKNDGSIKPDVNVGKRKK